ncbi:PhzF family phenazine biosynthesis isomerase [Kitasatospora sp. NBC_00240]|uniref:PhzF family phenazine biosynthesis protein n=1 Tax=Kitasatospora sp. NBC_00240 TaxID=2903567 RepID=UPI00225B95AC|nr:PhzF family phenazine biosynthesis isomerase [Kitasatospora sp. NBC_00240]MCX5210083.1 PhzF family phenazine biosynthesis isomerase [Kitasatospora sp. NBC_00240]
MSTPSVTLVDACLRGDTGGSPTAIVLLDEPLSDEQCRRVPVEWGTSHAVLLRSAPSASTEGAGLPTVGLRFFTAEEELPACGHGTVAALAFLAARAGAGKPYRAVLRTSQRSFDGWCDPDGDRLVASFDPGPVDLREPTADERALVLPALGLGPDGAGPDVRIAGVGRERILVPVADRAALASLAPDLDRLREACDRFGLLGAYVYSTPSADGTLAARMFAPSIGVPEDIANANSTACLAAHLAGRGVTEIAVDMGDALGSPATITASAAPGGPGAVIRLGGAAKLAVG